MDLINALNWILLAQFTVVGIVWVLANKFYSKSQFLQSNKPIKVAIKSLPKLEGFVEKIVNSSGFLYLVGIVIVLPSILIGIMVFFSVSSGAILGFKNLLFSKNWWEQILICVSVIWRFR